MFHRASNVRSKAEKKVVDRILTEFDSTSWKENDGWDPRGVFFLVFFIFCAEWTKLAKEVSLLVFFSSFNRLMIKFFFSFPLDWVRTNEKSRSTEYEKLGERSFFFGIVSIKRWNFRRSKSTAKRLSVDSVSSFRIVLAFLAHVFFSFLYLCEISSSPVEMKNSNLFFLFRKLEKLFFLSFFVCRPSLDEKSFEEIASNICFEDLLKIRMNWKGNCFVQNELWNVDVSKSRFRSISSGTNVRNWFAVVKRLTIKAMNIEQSRKPMQTARMSA